MIPPSAIESDSSIRIRAGGATKPGKASREGRLVRRGEDRAGQRHSQRYTGAACGGGTCLMGSTPARGLLALLKSTACSFDLIIKTSHVTAIYGSLGAAGRLGGFQGWKELLCLSKP